MLNELLGFVVEHFNIPLYLITLVISIKYYKKYYDTVLKFFPIIIAYTFFNELLGYFIRYTDYAFFTENQIANDLIYNLYSIIFFGFFYIVYYQSVSSQKTRVLMKWLAGLAFLSFVINALFTDPLKVSLFYANSINSWILVIFIVLYLKDKTDWKWEREKYNLMTWISIGLGTFYFFFPILYLIGFLKYEIWQEYHLRMVLRMLIVLMNLLFCIGFIKSHRRAFG
ncbi:MAG: hypothetical protein ED555_07865 [Allomuricauda sp.]|nr:MAG: hypothetical protein ED555_07865 [Allomuricauda sp.]